MPKKCSQCKKEFEVTDQDRRLGEQFAVPERTCCFECTQKQLLCRRNTRTLYARKCDSTGEDMISIYPADSPFKVYKSDIWYSDKWSPFDFGRDIDFSRPFFEQFDELQRAVPWLGLLNMQAVDSDYCNNTYGNTRCYLIFGGDHNTDCMYGELGMRNKDTLDCDLGNDNELCYEVMSSFNCYSSRFVYDSKNCNDCAYVIDCASCSDCILCTNLKNKQYCIENMQYGRDEYFERKKQLLSGSYEQQRKNSQRFLELRGDRIVKYAHLITCEDSTGDYLKSCKASANTFDGSESENMKDIIFTSLGRDCFYSSMIGDKSELVYNSISTYNVFRALFSHFIVDSSDVEYSCLVMNSKNIFGCAAMNRGEYCILNKQYTPDEFHAMRARLIEHMKKTGEWGEFFPPSLSQYGYNETVAYQYFPLSKEEALSQGFRWQDNLPGTRGKETVAPGLIPDMVDDAPDSFSKEILACADCGKNYRILSQELAFYKKIQEALPRRCPDCRYVARLKIRNPHELWHRQCMCDQSGHEHVDRCTIEFETSYAPNRSERVYCEACYQKEVI
ncbi:MAG: hypothetical protein Q8P56_04545 [Candidatus Uhrbacteria bacterium]|nr:hypothetical protein [Candidatus Uhrbacteria bacterium]